MYINDKIKAIKALLGNKEVNYVMINTLMEQVSNEIEQSDCELNDAIDYLKDLVKSEFYKFNMNFFDLTTVKNSNLFVNITSAMVINFLEEQDNKPCVNSMGIDSIL